MPKLPRGGRYWVAYSGGLDSTVLLHALKRSRVKPLNAIHVHHGLQPQADAWLSRCRENCRRLRVPFVAERVVVKANSGEGPEAAARHARYAALRRHLKENDCLVTAHHADDQAETLLLRLLRGSGVRGLSAMRVLSAGAAGLHWRPLLSVSRAQVRAYARSHALDWIEDPQNHDPRYTRSWLRTEIIPALQARFPSLARTLVQTAERLAEASDLLEEYAQQDLSRASRGPLLEVSALRAMTQARRRQVLRLWLERRGQWLPSAQTLQRIEHDLLQARRDAAPVIVLDGAELRRYRDALHLLPRLAPVPAKVRLTWTARGTLTLPDGCGRLQGRALRSVPGLEVRFASGGEALKPAGDRHTRSLKNLCQQAGIPPWVRQRMPLVYEGGELIAVADRWRSTKAGSLNLVWRQPSWMVDESSPARPRRGHPLKPV